MRFPLRPLCAAGLLWCSLTGVSFAQEEPAPPPPPPAEKLVETKPAEADDWQVSLTPCLWLAKTKIDLTMGDRSRSIQLSAKDTLGALQFGAAGRIEARKGDWGAFADLQYISLGNTLTGGPRNQLELTTNVKNTIWQVAGTYRVVAEEDVNVDILAGVRGYSIGAEMTLDPIAGLRPGSVLFAGAHGSKSLSFMDPIVGVRSRWALSDDLGFSLYGDVGGFGVGSGQTWRASADLDYKISPGVSLVAGYMIMNFEHHEGANLDEFRYNANMSGPVLGATFHL